MLNIHGVADRRAKRVKFRTTGSNVYLGAQRFILQHLGSIWVYSVLDISLGLFSVWDQFGLIQCLGSVWIYSVFGISSGLFSVWDQFGVIQCLGSVWGYSVFGISLGLFSV